jgi:rhodanese-related sulfurtransferase
LGYKNILLYSEGLAGWKKAGFPLEKDETIRRSEIPPLTLSELQGKLGDVYVLDIRPADMYEQGHVKGSRNIPFHLVSRRFREIPAGQKIVIVDVLGNPEYMPIGWFLKSKGYNDVIMLKGGMNAWQKEGLPLER